MLVSETLYVLFLGLMLQLYLFLGQLGKAGYVGVLIPLIGPIPFIVLHIFVAVLQAFVFTILPVIYVAGAVGEEH
jgi:F0F1-type ATP synthase membrane subunit a